jgi:hypothetical protein
MRRSAGGCYDIGGIQVRRVMDGPTETVALPRWRARQADLWAESSTIAHVHHHLTAEERGLWHAMWTELQAVNAAIARLEGDAPGRS